MAKVNGGYIAIGVALLAGWALTNGCCTHIPALAYVPPERARPSTPTETNRRPGRSTPPTYPAHPSVPQHQGNWLDNIRNGIAATFHIPQTETPLETEIVHYLKSLCGKPAVKLLLIGGGLVAFIILSKEPLSKLK
jgi:hypothetical protein